MRRSIWKPVPWRCRARPCAEFDGLVFVSHLDQATLTSSGKSFSSSRRPVRLSPPEFQCNTLPIGAINCRSQDALRVSPSAVVGQDRYAMKTVEAADDLTGHRQ
jgi:hypothetical protein